MKYRVAVVGAGWAGLAAAVAACRAGHAVTVFETARHLGGRASTLETAGLSLDNGQHILVGAYRETLGLMQFLGVDLGASFVRSPLRLIDPSGRGLSLRGGPATLALLVAVLGMKQVTLRDKLAFLRLAQIWRARKFECADDLSVAELCASVPPKFMRDLIEPLCVAALNTPAQQASAQVFLNILRDALFGPPGGADLLLPRVALQDLMPRPALNYLQAQGCRVVTGQRVTSLVRQDAVGPAGQLTWSLTGTGDALCEPLSYDHVIVATPSREAARLIQPWSPEWSAMAAALHFEPIVTVWLRLTHLAPWAHPMLTLPTDAASPAQFAFDCGVLGGDKDTYAFVISAAGDWVRKGLDATTSAVMRQAQRSLATRIGAGPSEHPALVEVRAIKHATFACNPGLRRPPSVIAPGLTAAGDYVDGPYPATLEGAVRSGLASVRKWT